MKPLTHKRRTPCCEDEAIRYLAEHDTTRHSLIYADARAALLDELEAAVRALPKDRGDEAWSTVDRTAVLRLIQDRRE